MRLSARLTIGNPLALGKNPEAAIAFRKRGFSAAAVATPARGMRQRPFAG